MSNFEVYHQKRSSVANTVKAVFLYAPFKQPDIESWVVQQSFRVAAPKILLVALNRCVSPLKNDTRDAPVPMAQITRPWMTNSLLASP